MNIRELDGMMGPPLLRALAVGRQHRALPGTPARIGFLKTRGIGDAVLSSVLTKAVRRHWPAAQLVFIADASVFPIAPLIPEVDEIVRISTKWPWQSLLPLHKAKLDILFDLGAWSRIEALLTVLAGARYTVGFETAGQNRHFAYDCAVTHRADLHEAKNYLNLLRAIQPDAVIADIVPSLISSETIDIVKARLHEISFGTPYLVFHPWPGGTNPAPRAWPEDNWVGLGLRLAATGRTIVISGAAGDFASAESLRARLLAQGAPAERIVNLAGKASVKDMYWVLRQADAVIAVNTGIMHMAAAVGTRTVGLHGPTNPARWGPLGPAAHVVGPIGQDCGFLNLGFEYRRQPCDCMARITVAQVEDSLRAELTSPSFADP